MKMFKLMLFVLACVAFNAQDLMASEHAHTHAPKQTKKSKKQYKRSKSKKAKTTTAETTHTHDKPDTVKGTNSASTRVVTDLK